MKSNKKHYLCNQCIKCKACSYPVIFHCDQCTSASCTDIENCQAQYNRFKKNNTSMYQWSWRCKAKTKKESRCNRFFSTSDPIDIYCASHGRWNNKKNPFAILNKFNNTKIT